MSAALSIILSCCELLKTLRIIPLRAYQSLTSHRSIIDFIAFALLTDR
jgi:hypothetical protein